MVSDTRDRSRDKATLPKQLPGRACQEARCCVWKTVFRGWASGFSAFHLQRKKVVASGSPSLPFQKVLFRSVRNAHRGIRGFWHGTCLQRHRWRVQHPPCFAGRKQHSKRKGGGEEEQEDCYSSAEAPVTIRGFSFFRGFYLSDWGDTWSQLGELTEGQCLSRLYPSHGLLPGKQGWVLVLAGEHSVCRETGNQVTWGLGDFFFPPSTLKFTVFDAQHRQTPFVYPTKGRASFAIRSPHSFIHALLLFLFSFSPHRISLLSLPLSLFYSLLSSPDT